MLDRLVAITNAIYSANDRCTLLDVVESGCKSLDFDSFLIFCHKSRKPEMILDATLTNFSRSFLADYERFGWSEADFMLDIVLQTDSSLAWDTSKVRYDDVHKQSYVDFMHASHLLTGIVVPLKHRPQTASAFAVSCGGGRPIGTGMIQTATILGNAAMTKAEILGLCPEVSSDAAKAGKSLTPIQQAVLSWIAEGKSNIDIATIMNMNERAVRYHVTEILRKLGVATRTQAAAIRRSLGFDHRD